MENKYILKVYKEDKGILCSKVTINGFDYYVSDDLGRIGSFITNGKEVEQVTYRDMVTGHYSIKPNGRTPMAQYRRIMDWDVIIATNNPNIDIPKVVNGVDNVKKNLYFFKQAMNPYETGGQSYTAYEKGFIEGYNKSQETHAFSEEDMIEFAEWIEKEHWWKSTDTRYALTVGLWTKTINGDFNPDEGKTTKEILQLWKEQQPKVVYYE